MAMVSLTDANRREMQRGARCDLCPLKGQTVVPASPPRGKLRLIIVGDSPGRLDENLKTPMAGMGGKLLDGVLKENRMPRGACHVTHAALCRGDTDKENDRAAECCAPRLLRELAETDPTGVAPILTLGKAPARAVLGVRSILVARGFIWDAKHIDHGAVRAAFKKASKAVGPRKDVETLKAETLGGRAKLEGRVVVPSLALSFILRADTWLPVFKIDVGRAVRLARGEIGAREDHGEHLVGGPEILTGLDEVVSCDIETTGIDPMATDILCIGMSDGTHTRVIWPWKRRYARAISAWLRTRKAVVFHNGL